MRVCPIAKNLLSPWCVGRHIHAYTMNDLYHSDSQSVLYQFCLLLLRQSKLEISPYPSLSPGMRWGVGHTAKMDPPIFPLGPEKRETLAVSLRGP